jgi:hypothetical protein
MMLKPLLEEENVKRPFTSVFCFGSLQTVSLSPKHILLKLNKKKTYSEIININQPRNKTGAVGAASIAAIQEVASAVTSVWIIVTDL